MKTIKNEVSVEDHSLHKDDGLTCNGIADEVKAGQGRTVEVPSVQQHVPQEQPQGDIVCWERFSHFRSLNVLLVENDDCTRHVVTALLRNCSYEVIEAANGLQALKILGDLTNHIDLVLTEVAMPCLSGIHLLCKIMAHKTRNNIPVIMMSSHDSMGLVFNCLSKGAVDFLVKPIRKNELKNLWQHVWRRCHSSSGSGSESGTQAQKSVNSKSLEKSDNNTGSSDDDDNGREGLNNGNGSDNGSGTQSSWTKQAVEIGSPKPVSQWNQIAGCLDSTCAQVVHSNAEICRNKMVRLATKECLEQKEQLVKEMKVDSSRDVGMIVEYRNEVPIKTSQLDIKCENQSSKLRCKGPSLSDALTSTSDFQIHGGEFEAPVRRLKSSDIENKATNNKEELPSVELSLKRLRGVKNPDIKIQDERNVLRRSNLSAFSRYNAVSNAKKSPTGYAGSNSPHNNNLEVTKKDSSHGKNQSHSSDNPPKQNTNGTSNNIDMGSTTNSAFMLSAVISEQAVSSTTKCLYQSSAFQLIKDNLIFTSQQVNTEDATATKMLESPRVGTHMDSTIQDFCCHYEKGNCIANMQHQLPPDHDDASVKKMAAAAPHCGSSNAVEVLVEGNIGNYHKSASGSNNGSNGQNGSSTAVNAGQTNKESNNRISGNSGSGDASGIGWANGVDQNKISQRHAALTKFAGQTNKESNNRISGNSGSGDASGSGWANGVDQNKISQRHAALTKFRQKRKERCFQKKVRYESRKNLAERRPRFRGQFVQQSSIENASVKQQKADSEHLLQWHSDEHMLEKIKEPSCRM